MDIVEFNKMTQRKRVRSAEDHLYNLDKITKEDAVILLAYSLKKEYGVFRAVDILHSVGVERIKI